MPQRAFTVLALVAGLVGACTSSPGRPAEEPAVSSSVPAAVVAAAAESAAAGAPVDCSAAAILASSAVPSGERVVVAEPPGAGVLCVTVGDGVARVIPLGEPAVVRAPVLRFSDSIPEAGAYHLVSVPTEMRIAAVRDERGSELVLARTSDGSMLLVLDPAARPLGPSTASIGRRLWQVVDDTGGTVAEFSVPGVDESAGLPPQLASVPPVGTPTPGTVIVPPSATAPSTALQPGQVPIVCDAFVVDENGVMAPTPVQTGASGFWIAAHVVVPETVPASAVARVEVPSMPMQLASMVAGFPVIEQRDFVRVFALRSATLVPGSVTQEAVTGALALEGDSTVALVLGDGAPGGGEITFPASSFEVVAGVSGSALEVVLERAEITLVLERVDGGTVTIRAICTPEVGLLASAQIVG